jgi:cytochrome c oxidase subunit IV
MTTPEHTATHDTAHKKHPSTRTYINVFIWLAVLTVIEVAVAAVPLPAALVTLVLVAIAILKAGLVVLYYMHLRYDSAWYWVILIVPLAFVILLTRYLIIR